MPRYSADGLESVGPLTQELDPGFGHLGCEGRLGTVQIDDFMLPAGQEQPTITTLCYFVFHREFFTIRY